MYKELLTEIESKHAKLLAVSKTKSNEEILELYQKGQRLFGENRVQELLPKYEALPKDISWHLIGHLQSNKVKFIAPFVKMIHSIDSFKLLEECNRQAAKCSRTIDVLLQIHIAKEETKFGLSEPELFQLLDQLGERPLKNIRIAGLMGMATNTHNETVVAAEFEGLRLLFDKVKQNYFPGQHQFCELSMGMSSDYKIALEHGATIIRIGSLLFGAR
ncbi:MAG: YggS family pyridoxal phosphate-dependent enzyme [Chitinophagales bacterium]